MENYYKLKYRKEGEKLDITLASLSRIKDLKSLNDVYLEIEEVNKRIRSIV